jgi:uncharacterized protein with HEPN domain
MSKRDYWLYISDIKDCINKILDYTYQKNYNDLISTSMLLDAVVRNFEIIGEAARNVPKDLRKQYPQIEWKYLTGLRNIIIHEYFGIDTEIIWKIIQDEIKDLLKEIEFVLRDRPNGK